MWEEAIIHIISKGRKDTQENLIFIYKDVAFKKMHPELFK
jgi:hypothetical protein